MIKILHILSALDGGGVESMLKSYYEQIENCNVQFDFIVHGSKVGILENFFLQKGCHIYHISPKKKNFFKYRHELKTILKMNRYDIVHCHQGEKGHLVVKYAKELSKAKCICHAHGSFPYKAVWKRILHSWRLKRIVHYTDAYCACSQDAAKNTFGEKTCKEYPIQIIYNAFKLENFYYNQQNRESIRLSNNIKEEDFLLGMVGRLSIEKNHKFIFEVLTKIENPYIKLMIIGDGPLYGDLQKYVVANHLVEKVIFIGKVQDSWRYYSALDMFLFPSLFEGLGLALVEAQINGLPCLISENISEDAIIAKEQVKVEKLILDKWVNILENYKDMHDRRNLVVKTFEKYDIRTQYNNLLELYWRLLK